VEKNGLRSRGIYLSESGSPGSRWPPARSLRGALFCLNGAGDRKSQSWRGALHTFRRSGPTGSTVGPRLPCERRRERRPHDGEVWTTASATLADSRFGNLCHEPVHVKKPVGRRMAMSSRTMAVQLPYRWAGIKARNSRATPAELCALHFLGVRPILVCRQGEKEQIHAPFSTCAQLDR
jgi:hypothetical protein